MASIADAIEKGAIMKGFDTNYPEKLLAWTVITADHMAHELRVAASGTGFPAQWNTKETNTKRVESVRKTWNQHKLQQKLREEQACTRRDRKLSRGRRGQKATDQAVTALEKAGMRMSGDVESAEDPR